MKDRKIELRERAIAILGLNNSFSDNELKLNFRRQIKIVNPNSPDSEQIVVACFTNSEVACLIIQAYNLLSKKKSPTSMLENDKLVAALIGLHNIVPLSETFINQGIDLFAHYDFEGGWPDPSKEQRKQHQYKFKGL